MLSNVEAALSTKDVPVRATGYIQALNSIENRVYSIELEDGQIAIAKFYRPARWTFEQIREEHDFIARLNQGEIPSIEMIPQTGPTVHPSCATLGTTENGIFFSVSKRIRGRIMDELAPNQLRQLGRFLARLHGVGSSFQFQARATLSVATHGQASLDFLLQSPHLKDNGKARYQNVANRILQTIAPRLNGQKTFPIHGDCHLGNVLWNETGPFFLDFDDSVNGPPVQDVWMIIRGRDDTAKRDRDELFSGYEEMRSFDYDTLALIEPLRAIRIIHYAAWIAKRWGDPSFSRLFPEFGTERYWNGEIEALEELSELL